MKYIYINFNLKPPRNLRKPGKHVNILPWFLSSANEGKSVVSLKLLGSGTEFLPPRSSKEYIEIIMVYNPTGY